MANTIILKQSPTASNVPAVGELVTGELAINTTDKKLYSKDGAAVFQVFDGVYGTAAAVALNTAKVTDSGEPATLRSGGTPTLNTGVTALEMRTLIAAAALASPTFTGTVTLPATNMADNILDQPVLRDYGISHTAPTVSANAVTLDCVNGNSFAIDMDPATAAVVVTLSNPPPSGTYGEVNIAITMGTPAWGITWPGSVVWMSGGAPTLTTTNDVVDLVHLFTVNAGTTWYGTYSLSAGGATTLAGLTDVTITAAASGDLLRHNGAVWVDVAETSIAIAGDVTGTLGATVVGDNSHAHTSTTISALDAGDTTTGVFAAARLANTAHAVTPDNNLAQYNRFASAVTMDGVVTPSAYGGYAAMTNGPTGMSYDPFLVMGSATDVSIQLVVPRTVSRGLAYRGETSDVYGAWHYAGWTTTAADAQLSLYAKLAGPNFSGTPQISSVNIATVNTNWDAGDITTGTLAVLRGGTGVTTSSGSGPNALGTVDNAAGNDTIVQRTAAGYIYANYFNGSGSFATAGTGTGMVNFIGTNGSDTFARSYSQAGAILRLAAGAWNFTSTLTLNSVAVATVNTNWDAGDITTGTLAVLRGGTGVTAKTGTGNVVLSASPTFTGTVTTAAINMADNLLDRAYLDDYAVLHQTVTGIASTTINYSSGQAVTLALGAANITTLTISNWPATGRFGCLEILVTQGATARTIAWPSTVNWPGGTAPNLATANGRFLVYLRTVDAGVTHIEGTFTTAMS